MHDTELATPPPTMEEILQTIRGIIAGKVDNVTESEKEEVLELTEMMDTEGNIVSLKSSAAPKTGDLLNDIDNALGEEKKQPVETPAPALNKVEDLFATKNAPVENKEPKAESAKPEVTKAPEPKKEEAPKVEAPKVEAPKAEAPKAKPEPKVEQPAAPKAADPAPVNNDIDKKGTPASRLVSEQVANETSNALKMLVDSVHRPITDGLSFRSGNTLEDLVIELIKPELSKWLEANLPSIVKHVVEKEVKKLIPKDDD